MNAISASVRRDESNFLLRRVAYHTSQLAADLFAPASFDSLITRDLDFPMCSLEKTIGCARLIRNGLLIMWPSATEKPDDYFYSAFTVAISF